MKVLFMVLIIKAKQRKCRDPLRSAQLTRAITDRTALSTDVKKRFAAGPTKKAQMIVPIPTVPPSAKPIPVKSRSTITRTMPNGFCR